MLPDLARLWSGLGETRVQSLPRVIGKISPSEVMPLATEYVEKGLRGPGEMEDSVTDWVINIERRGRRE